MIPVIGPKDKKQLTLQRWSLQDSADKVQVSKKSLDDYLLQLRFGRKFGFDFETHKDSKVGVLRAFVKNKKKELRAKRVQQRK